MSVQISLLGSRTIPAGGHPSRYIIFITKKNIQQILGLKKRCLTLWSLYSKSWINPPIQLYLYLNIHIQMTTDRFDEERCKWFPVISWRREDPTIRIFKNIEYSNILCYSNKLESQGQLKRYLPRMVAMMRCYFGSNLVNSVSATDPNESLHGTDIRIYNLIQFNLLIVDAEVCVAAGGKTIPLMS